MKAIRKARGLVCLLFICLMTTSLFAQEVVPITLKVGLKNQVGGHLTITETKEGMFEKGDLCFTVADKGAGVFLNDVKVETTGGLKGVTTKVTEGKNGQAKVTLSRESKKPASITLKDFDFTVDRTVPEGTYDLEISGSAISSVGDDKIVIKDFIKITTPGVYKESTSLAVGTSSFTLNETTYRSNNYVYEMGVAPYIEGKGYIMVPVRYVAQAFGIKETNILFNEGNIIIFTGSRTINLSVGSNKATINGVQLTMEVPVTNVEGRVYVSASELAKLLGITCKWDADTKTAYFINE